MYTLEDDEETSARMRKRDFHNSPYASSADARAPSDAQQTLDSGASATPSRRAQITSSFKKLAMPGQAIANTAEKRRAIAALLVACASVFITSMDETVVVTALPKIILDPGINIPITQLDHAAWIISAYLLGFVIAMPLMGRISDIFGRRRIMLICLSIFGAGSLLCALAPVLGQSVDISFLSNIGIDTTSQGLVWLVAARFIQAIGGGAVIPVAIAVVSDFYGKGRLGLALGMIGAVTEAGGVVGPLYGALIVSTLGWTYIFYLNVPIVLILIVGVIFFTPVHQRLHEGIDWLGAALLGIALTCLSLGLAQQSTDLGATTIINGNTPQNNPVALIAALIFFILFILLGQLQSWRVPHFSLRSKPHFSLVQQKRWPVIDLSVFKRFSFSASALVSVCLGVALIIAMAGIPLFVDTVYSQQISASDVALVSGLALLRMTMMIPVGALLGGWLCSRFSCRLVGLLGLLFAAVGFYLMSRWPISLDWTQITISTMTTGMGFGLVVAPISTTAINSVRATQAGMSAAIVTALRMVGMILGLAALTSWGLAYFKQLVAQFPSLPLSATPAQFAQWTHNYANHVIASAHTVYTTIFFVTGLFCLVALVPAAFLWGKKPALEETLLQADSAAVLDEPAIASDSVVVADPAIASASSVIAEPVMAADPVIVADPAIASASSDVHDSTTLAVTSVLDVADPVIEAPPPFSPTPGDNDPKQDNSRSRRRMVLALVGVGLAMLLVAGGLTALLLWPSGSPNARGSGLSATATAVAGMRMIDLAMNNTALTSIFVSQLGTNGGALTNIETTPTPNNGLVITLNLNINTHGLNRVMPVEMDTTIGMDSHQNLQLRVLHLKRDGRDAGSAAAASMQNALNQMVLATVMPALRGQLKGARLVSITTSSSLSCGGGAEMLVLLIAAPPIKGMATQSTPMMLCFTKPVNLNQLLLG